MVNLVRSGTKQPQPFSTSAEGQARHLPLSVCPAFLPLAFADIASASDAGSLCFVRSLRKRARGVLAVGLCRAAVGVLSAQRTQRARTRTQAALRAARLFFSIVPLAAFNRRATRVRAASRIGFARHCY